MNITVKIKY